MLCIAVTNRGLQKTGKLTDLQVPVIETGSTVIDFEFSPFDNKLLATGGENGRVRLWKVPAEGLTSLKTNVTVPDADLLNHNHKIVTVNFHPLVNNLLVSTSGDMTAKVWDLNKNADVLTLRVRCKLITFEHLLINVIRVSLILQLLLAGTTTVV